MKPVFPSYFFVIVFVFAGVAFSEAAQAGHYELIKGKGVEVCEAYGKNLNSLPSDIPPPVCEAKVNPKSPDIKATEWRKWSTTEIWQRRHLVRDMERSIAGMVGGSDKSFNETAFFSRLKSDLDKSQYALSISQAIFKWRDGKQTTYIKREATCDAVTDYDEPMGRIFFVLNKTADQIIRVETLTAASQTHFRRPDIVLYKGEPFLQYWVFEELEITGITSAAYCKYRYTKPADRGDSK